MLTLRILSGEAAGREIPAGRFPFTIGRDSGAGLRSREPGVWDRHGILELDAATGFHIRAGGDADVLVNGEPVRSHRLRNGDVLDLGGLKLSCWLGPVRQRSMKLREGLFWAAVALVVAAEIALLNLFG